MGHTEAAGAGGRDRDALDGVAAAGQVADLDALRRWRRLTLVLTWEVAEPPSTAQVKLPHVGSVE
jgi:hypothetical protein